MGRQSRLRNARKSGGKKPARREPSVGAPPVDLDIPNPYDSAEEAKADIELVHEAWKLHYGDQIPDDFVPPLFLRDDQGFVGAEWMAVFRDLLVEKYGSLDAAEPRMRFVLGVVAETMVDEIGEGVLEG
jgi:hypothetical protein